MKSLKVFGVVALAAGMAACVPDWARENETGLLMTVSDVISIAGGEGGTEGSILLSDVSDTFNDDARVTVMVFRKNPTVTATSPLEAVRLESYQVQYFRSDGRNVEGLDVPTRITGSLNSVVIEPPGGGDITSAEVLINVVRHQAKQEPPLRNLVGVFLLPNSNANLIFGGEGIITTSAEITIYGRLVSSGEVLRAVGRLQVTFADFADADAQ